MNTLFVISIAASLLAFYYIISLPAGVENISGRAAYDGSISCLSSGSYWCSSGIDDGYCSGYGDCEDGYSYEPKLVALPDIAGSAFDRSTNVLSLKVQLESTHPIESVVMQLDSERVEGNCETYGTSAVCVFEKAILGLAADIQPIFIADVNDYEQGFCAL